MIGADRMGRWRDGRPTRLLILGGIVFAAMIAGVAGFLISETRTKEIADAKRELLTLNLSLAEQTARAMQGVDLILQSLADQLRSDGVDSAEDFARIEAGPDTYKILKARAADVPQLDAITLIAADGHLINFSRLYPVPEVNVADRDYFQALKNSPTNQPYFSAPVENRATGTWVIYVARRVDDSAGRFIGLVLGAIKLEYFEDLYRSLQLGRGSGISLWRRDGILLARYPSIDGIGRSFQIKSFTETLRNNDVGVYEVANSIDGFRRIVATRVLRDYPLVVNVTRTFDEILGDWRRAAMMIGGAGLLCIVAVGLVVWTLVRRFATYERLSQALVEKAEAVLARERAENELHQSQKLEAVGKLTTGIAHDFNNLLTTVIGNLEFLQRETQNPTIKRRVTAIRGAVDRAATLTGQLLAFSRKQHLFPEAVDLNGLIGSMVDMLRSSLGGTVRIELALHAELWRALIDRAQIELVLLNLTINARDAMPSGGVLTITTDNISVGAPTVAGDPPEGDHVLVTIGDTGTGMTEEVLARAFDPFFTTKPVGKGTGLGLSQAYGTVRQLGGGIRIDSRLGQGTTIEIYLPRAEAVPGEARAPQLAPPADVAATTARWMTKVLVVDDDLAVRQAISEMLLGSGFAVVEAEGGKQALDLLASDPLIGLIVMDFAMPELNGAEVARLARSIRANLPILFVTGFDDVDSLGGENWVLQKPFAQEVLAAKVRLVLAGGGSRVLDAGKLA